jgi:twitching motility protein PilT
MLRGHGSEPERETPDRSVGAPPVRRRPQVPLRGVGEWRTGRDPHVTRAATVEDCAPSTSKDRHMPLDELLSVMLQRGGSDLHLTEGAPPLLRIDGELHPVDGGGDLDEEQASELVLSTIPENLRADFEVNKSVDFSFAWQDRARFRATRSCRRARPRWRCA